MGKTNREVRNPFYVSSLSFEFSVCLFLSLSLFLLCVFVSKEAKGREKKKKKKPTHFRKSLDSTVYNFILGSKLLKGGRR